MRTVIFKKDEKWTSLLLTCQALLGRDATIFQLFPVSPIFSTRAFRTSETV